MTLPEATSFVTAIGGLVSAIGIPFGLWLGYLTHKQGKETHAAVNGALLAQTREATVASGKLAQAVPSAENIAAASDSAAVLKSRENAKLEQ